MAKKRVMKRAETKPAPEMQVAQRLVAELTRVHLRKPKY